MKRTTHIFDDLSLQIYTTYEEINRALYIFSSFTKNVTKMKILVHNFRGQIEMNGSMLSLHFYK